MLHFRSPLQKTPEAMTLPPDKLNKLEDSDLVHLDAGIGLHTPEKVRAAPGREVVPASCVPEKAEHIAHARIIRAARGQ